MKKTDSAILQKAADTWRIGIVYSSFYKEEMEALVSGAEQAFLESGIKPEYVLRYEAPGSFEVPLLGAALAEAKKVDALVGLGIIVEGETFHAQLLANEAARGIMDVQLRYRIPFAFEILYVKHLKDAQARTKGDANKGREAAYAVLHSLHTLNRIRR